jgi:hypothetical protein
MCLASELTHEEAGLVVCKSESLHFALLSTDLGSSHGLGGINLIVHIIHTVHAVHVDIEAVEVLLILAAFLMWRRRSKI